MSQPAYLQFIGLIYCCLFSNLGMALDWTNEAQTSKQLAKLYAAANVVQLPSDEHPFLALYREAAIPSAHGGVLIIHDIGGHADWPSVISPLRNDLPEQGWHTLSLQMPLPSDPLTEKDLSQLVTTASKRILAGTQFFKDKGIYNLVLIAHRMGATIALDYLTTRPQGKNDVFAFVAIGLYDHPLLPQYSSAELVTKLDIPMLDLVGALDNRYTLEALQRRAAATKQADKQRHRQLEIPGANDQFDGLQQTLARRITGWLRSQAPGAVVEKRKLPVDN